MRKKEEYLSLVSAAHLDPKFRESLHRCTTSLPTKTRLQFFVLPLMMIGSPKLPFRRISSRCLFFLSRCCLDCLGNSRFILPLALLGGLGGPLLGTRCGPVLGRGRGGTGTSTSSGTSSSTSTVPAGSGSLPVTTSGGEGRLNGNGSLLLSAGDELLLLNLLLGLSLRVAVCEVSLA